MRYADLKGYLIAIDLDGTLVENFDDIDVETFLLLKKVARKNTVVIATGRPFRSSKIFYDLLELKTPIINYNGALVHNPRDSSFPTLNLYLKKDEIISLIKANQDEIDTIFCEKGDTIYLQEMKDYIKPYLHLLAATVETGDLAQILPDEIHSSILFVKKDGLQTIENYLKAKSPHLALRKWYEDQTLICELYNPMVSKAKALATIVNYYHLDPEKTIAIGDGQNDIEMLEYAKIGVAVKGCPQALSDRATIIVDPGKDKSIKEFLKTKIK